MLHSLYNAGHNEFLMKHLERLINLSDQIKALDADCKMKRLYQIGVMH